METWIMVRAKRARTAERPTQPSLDLRSRAPWFYPDRLTARCWALVPRECPMDGDHDVTSDFADRGEVQRFGHLCAHLPVESPNSRTWHRFTG